MKEIATGFLRGTGSAINVSLGWIPDYVKIVNLTDGDKVHENFLLKVIAFTSGGTTELKPGDKLHGNTSDATAIIQQVILDSGSWAGGDAAGWLVLRPATISGTFQSETAYREGVDADGTDGITVAAADQDGIDVDTEVAGTTTAATNVSEYVGSTTAARGFTVGATISEDAKLLGYVAAAAWVIEPRPFPAKRIDA
jgi:hypothetical protein